jgi:hypothetical protein
MAKKWIKGAIKHPGALRASAKRAGAIGKSNTIKKAWLNKQAKKSGMIGRRARLAKTLSSFTNWLTKSQRRRKR